VLAIGKAGDEIGTGSLTVIDTEFINNEINSEGPGDLRGGALYGFAMPDITISGSVFTGNIGSNGGAVGGLGSSFRIVSTSFFDNRTNGTGPSGSLEGHGGAISLDAVTQNGVTGYLESGAVWYWTHEGALTVTNTTFADNACFANDTGMGGAVAISRGLADFIHCTIARNWAEFHGGGIQMCGDCDIGMQSCLFYQNTSDRDGGWAKFQINRAADRDLGGNLQYLSEDLVIDSNSDALVSENAVRADPQVLDLADNGGPTLTMALPTGSPALDAGATDNAPAADQRGLPRDATPDVGAFELQ